MDRCDTCTFVYDDLGLDDVPETMRSYPPLYTALLRRAEALGLERRRPRPQTWSALEYTCHVRDMLTVQHQRLGLALREDEPVFHAMGRDERAVAERYNDQDVTTVLGELDAAADRLATACADLDSPGWRRTGIYTWPERAPRTLAWIARHTVHELLHHRNDIEDGLEQLEHGNS